MPSLVEVVPLPNDPTKATLRFNFHPGQMRAWNSDKRFVVVLSGTQGGKTVFGPPWLYREIQRRGPGDYLVVSPTHTLMRTKALPEFLRLFQRQLKLGKYGLQAKTFTFSKDGALRTFGYHDPDNPTQIFFGHASDPESLESATAKALWADEAGQPKFKIGSWEALQRRLAIHKGRALITTTPYDLGWLKKVLHDPWVAAKQNHPDIDLVRFDSIENPAFPREEFERQKKILPRWKFDLFFRAIFTRPAGMVYTSFDETRHKIPRFAIPDHWPRRYLGLDFGGVHTAGVFLAEEMVSENGTPKHTGRYFLYREYMAGERSAAEHTYHLLKGEPRTPDCVGGSKSEGQWRREFAAGGTVNGQRVQGLPVRGPAIKDVEVGINRVFGAFALDKLYVFEDLAGLLDELGSYAYELDDMGEPTDKIDSPNDFHRLDALRYIIGFLNPDKQQTVLTGSPVARKGLNV